MSVLSINMRAVQNCHSACRAWWSWVEVALAAVMSMALVQTGRPGRFLVSVVQAVRSRVMASCRVGCEVA